MCRNVTAPTLAFSITCRQAILTKLSDSPVPASGQLRRALAGTKNRCPGTTFRFCDRGRRRRAGFRDGHLRHNDLEKPEMRHR